MQTQFVLIILLFCFIQATGCLMQGTGNVGQSISNEALRERRTQALGQRETALIHSKSFARLKQQAEKPGQGGGGGSAAQKATEALMEAAMQQAKAMRQARAAGQRPGEKQPQAMRKARAAGQRPPVELPEVFKEEYRPRLPPKVAKKILENHREDMSPEFREAITAYLRAIAERGRKKNIVPQKKK